MPKFPKTWLIAASAAIVILLALYVVMTLLSSDSQDHAVVTVAIEASEAQDSAPITTPVAEVSLEQATPMKVKQSAPSSDPVFPVLAKGADPVDTLQDKGVARPLSAEKTGQTTPQDTPVLAVPAAQEKVIAGHPFALYSHDFTLHDDKIKLSIVITDVGYDPHVAQFIVDTFPRTVTSALVPVGSSAQKCARILRSKGLEYMVMVPMEPIDYPDSNPGPQVLLTGIQSSQNQDVWQTIMQSYPQAMGIMPYMGSRFVRSEIDMRPFLQSLSHKGFCYCEGRYTRSQSASWAPDDLPYLKAQFDIPRGWAPQNVQKTFKTIRMVLDRKQSVVMTIDADMVNLKRLQTWLQTDVPDDVAITPLSAHMVSVQGDSSILDVATSHEEK